MKKKVISMMLAGAMVLSVTACGGKEDSAQTGTNTESAGAETDAGAAADAGADTGAAEQEGPVELVVTTTFAGEDSNAQNYKDAVKAWEAETGNSVVDTSATADETFKTRVATDFETGSEPDVLFFFNGADSNSFIEAGKVVSIDEIRAAYPDYASNMNEDLITASLVDDKKYAVPANGYWEAMFVNTEVLDAAGVAMPGADYTMDQFKADCEKIKAAFLIDGSWKVGGIVSSCQSDPNDPATLDTAKLDKFDVTYVPGKGSRKATDLVGGLSSGYFITRKAWDDPAKRAAAVSFVEYLTSDEMVPKFAQHGASALKNAPEVDSSEFNSLQIKAMNMMAGTTSLTGAVQDLFAGDCRVSTFDGMPEIVTGRVAAEDAVAEGLEAYHNQ
ncbi:MAG: extracellular solute-binding protein [Lachnospiraceae bacterium]|nr:extracellular solute-binding protein [Lachnospiraceae bacterium]